MTIWTAALFALFVWWFSTGAILWVVKTADRKGSGAGVKATLMSLPMLVLGFVGYWISLNDTSAFGACLAFLSALGIWGWIEVTFLTGLVTGPCRYALPSDTPEWERFLRAWGTLAYHEMLLVTTLVILILIGREGANIFGIWTFAVLFFARLSAKFNLYLGVPYINVAFLPDALTHLATYFRRRSLNWLFPVSVSALTFATACWLERVYMAQTDGQLIGFTLLTAITALALLEHWMMVLPIPDEKLWRWMLPAPKQPTPKATTLKGGHHGL
ncbi:MAG: putative photosynthetic complex assembly protein PuhE [Pseudomonadota bacterium]